MKAFVVTGHIVDFESRHCNLFEPEFFESFKEAREAAMAMVKIEQRFRKSPVLPELEWVGEDEFDVELNGHDGRLLRVKVRVLEND